MRMLKLVPFLLILCNLFSSCDENLNSDLTDTIKDTIPPVIVIRNKIDTAFLHTNYGAEKVEVIDNGKCLDVNITGTVNTTLPGTYFLDYDCTDAAGNMAATVTKTVIVAENSANFLNGVYNVVCTNTASIDGSSTPTITTDKYIATVSSFTPNSHFDLSGLKIGNEYVMHWTSVSGYSIEVSYFSTEFDWNSSVSTGTLSPTKNTFTIESTAYQYSPAIRYQTKNVYTKQLIEVATNK
jgi:hypothetical protein